MALKRIFLHHHHHHHHQSDDQQTQLQGQSPPQSSVDRHVAFADHNDRSPDDPNEQRDTIEPFIAGGGACATEQQSYRTHRRSSVQFLDKKLIQALSTTTPSPAADDEYRPVIGPLEDACKCGDCHIFFFLRIFRFLSSSH